MENSENRKFAFVLMPFCESLRDVYELGIKSACQDSNVICERVDEQAFQEKIDDRIIQQIEQADVIIAEMSDKNPNVFYEVGYAHCLGKRVILLTRDADNIPFDLKGYSHIVYDGKITKLKQELKRKVPIMLELPPPITNRNYLLTAPKPDIRVSIIHALYGTNLDKPAIVFTAKNHSPNDVYLGNFFLRPKNGGVVIFWHDVLRQPQKQDVLKPGQAYSFHVKGADVFENATPEMFVAGDVRNQLDDEFFADEEQLKSSLEIIYKHVKDSQLIE